MIVDHSLCRLFMKIFSTRQSDVFRREGMFIFIWVWKKWIGKKEFSSSNSHCNAFQRLRGRTTGWSVAPFCFLSADNWHWNVAWRCRLQKCDIQAELGADKPSGLLFKMSPCSTTVHVSVNRPPRSVRADDWKNMMLQIEPRSCVWFLCTQDAGIGEVFFCVVTASLQRLEATSWPNSGFSVHVLIPTSPELIPFSAPPFPFFFFFCPWDSLPKPTSNFWKPSDKPDSA